MRELASNFWKYEASSFAWDIQHTKIKVDKKQILKNGGIDDPACQTKQSKQCLISNY